MAPLRAGTPRRPAYVGVRGANRQAPSLLCEQVRIWCTDEPCEARITDPRDEAGQSHLTESLETQLPLPDRTTGRLVFVKASKDPGRITIVLEGSESKAKR